MSVESVLGKNNLYEIFSKLTDIGKSFRLHCYRAVEKMGVTLPETYVLITLAQSPEKNTVKAISESVHVSKGVISQAVESLKNKKYITVKCDERDRRYSVISLCPHAKPVVKKLLAAAREYTDRVVDGFSGQDISNMLAYVKKISETQNKEAKFAVSEDTEI